MVGGGACPSMAPDLLVPCKVPTASPATVADLVAELAAITTRPWTLMEVCGGQTHAILRWGLDQLLPASLRLIHGPGCPVCVTPAATLDAAMELARRPEVILCSYGDMLRVPGSGAANLLTVRAGGADVRLLTSPLQALELARAHPQRQVVFLAVGFETTAPATALLARRTLALGLANLSILTAHVRVAPAMETLLEPDRSDGTPTEVQGFLAAGHVCSVIGTGELRELVANHRLPVVVTGFEPVDLLRGVLTCVQLLEQGAPRLENAYPQVVREEGNPAARALLAEVFAVVDQPWRGFGMVRGGGLALQGPWAALEARLRFGLPAPHDHPTASSSRPGCPSCPPAASAGPMDGPINAPAADPCIAAAILRGRALPTQCTAFGSACTPEHPLGAPMVSSEGVCAAYQRYRQAPTPP